MAAEKKPVEIDRDIVYDDVEATVRKTGKPLLRRWPYLVAMVGVILIAVLLFTGPSEGGYIDSPPPEEQAERDSVYAFAQRIEQYRAGHDSLPGVSDVSLAEGFTYEKEDELTWSIETEAGLYYSSDMDLDAFARGEL